VGLVEKQNLRLQGERARRDYALLHPPEISEGILPEDALHMPALGKHTALPGAAF